MPTSRGNMQADDKYTPQQEQWDISTPDRAQRSVPDGWLFRKANAACNIWPWFTRTSTSTHLTARGLNASSLRSIQFNEAQTVLPPHPRAILRNNTADLLSAGVADPIRSSRNRGNSRKLDRADMMDTKDAQTDLNPYDDEYNMKHKRRGVAIILNHVNFEDMSVRKGTEKDTLSLKTSLGKLGFDVRIYTDPTLQMINKVLCSDQTNARPRPTTISGYREELINPFIKAAAEDHTDADCLIVVAMSHGESGLLHSVDSMYPVDVLWSPFTGDQCSSLAGKPKLFFIQACRGNQLDGGVAFFHATDSMSNTFKYSIPAYADILVAYSTYDGFYSWRNPDTGSWFIQALCAELDLHGRSRDLLTIMTFVNRRVAIEYQSYVPQNEKFHAKKQIPSIVSMLTRLVYFADKHVTTSNDIDDGSKEMKTALRKKFDNSYRMTFLKHVPVNVLDLEEEEPA
ncbi:Caspase-1 [Cyphomyrmex costatus]|uniref:Caspase-1 n=1 Tax=Cyphomyrmex costatus TaxID=456900 RepID=A0A195CU99_9HYME|nr:Caspase-1 [Cyphomyrmex costatus]